MSCKVNVKMPCINQESIINALKKMGYNPEVNKKGVIHFERHFFELDEEGKYNLKWEDFYRDGKQGEKIEEFKNKFLPLYDLEYEEYKRRKEEEARQEMLAFIENRKVSMIEEAKKRGFVASERKEGTKQILTLNRYVR